MWAPSLLPEMEPHAVQRQLGRAALHLRARADPAKTLRYYPAFPREADIHQADRLLRTAALRPSKAYGTDRQIGAETRAATERHRLSDCGTDRSLLLQQPMRHGEHLRLEAVVVGDETATEPGAR